MVQQTILRMEGIAKSFNGVPAIRNADLEARGGEAIAVMGANGAGKSTLMNILGGVFAPDKGRITIDGKEITIRNPRDAAAHGIAFVHQELTMFPTMSVAENIFIESLPTKGGLIDRSDMTRQSKILLDRVGCKMAVNTPVEKLGIGDRQLVEIARVLRHEARVIIFDEPTSSLTVPERERLFAVIRGLKAQGVVVVYITHFLDEIFNVCEKLMVMRNGETVGAGPMSDHDPGQVVHLMLGATEAGGRIRPPRVPEGETLLSVRGLTRGTAISDVSFDMKRGEIVGLWGLLGSGRTELLRALVGLDPVDAGQILWNGNGSLSAIRPPELQSQVGLVTEDRRGEGVHLPLSVEKNISLPNLAGLMNRWGLVQASAEAGLADQMIGRLKIKVSDRGQVISTLSGGNQQKVVFAKWLATRPRLLLLDEPTRGLDVNAKAEILKLVVELAEQGCSCLIVSSELEELMRVSDRYLVISRGRLTGELPGDASHEVLMSAIATLN